MLLIAGFPRSCSSRSSMPTVGSPVPLTSTASASAVSASRASWYVYDYDSPTKSAILIDSATIEVHNDRGNP